MAALDAVADWPAVAAVAVTDASRTLASTGPGDAFAWASVTKLVTALTVLTAVDRGEVALDEPAGPPGSTLRHLLAHASGLAPDSDDVLSAPGRRRIYSNRGIEVAADLVAQRAGADFAGLLRQRVLEPLGMSGTELTGSPAHGARGPVADLAALGRELLAPTLVPSLLPEATRPVFPGLAGVLPGFGRQNPNDWGLGFEIRDGKSPHWTGRANSPETFGHFGQSGSFLWVDPVAGLACAGLADRPFGEWAAEVWPPLADAVLASAQW
ncbi:serine hydrolase domain-containing protein [Actinoplanes sp. URMC 104]|uniref:serine hydrolase domain-containing protein n=1 Tax=Actinoplanes sp. URMC 104 TaxID=3423409 RepID=UPI003F1A5573